MVRDEPKLRRVREMMRARNLAALVLRLPENVTYLSDFWCGRGLTYLVFPIEKDPILIHPAGETFSRTWVSDVRLYKWETFKHLGNASNLGSEYVLKALSDLAITSGAIGVEENWELVLGSPLRYELNVIGGKSLTVLKEKLGAYNLQDASGLLIEARSIKTNEEIKALRKTNRIAIIGLGTFQRNLKPGLSEVEVSSRIEHEITTQGIMKQRAKRVVACAFVASGPTTAEAYKYVIGNTRRKLRRGDLVMLELDVIADGYSSDTTRTFVVGKPNRKQESLLEAILDSESIAISAIKPGISAAEVAQVSIDVIRRHGLGDYLVHRLGHGIGVGVHEPIPALHVESSDHLRPGMVHSVEPGIYGPKIGGIRIEDDVLDTKGGSECLSLYPRIQE
jgi:Xaa-Pro aminopeptidase